MNPNSGTRILRLEMQKCLWVSEPLGVFKLFFSPQPVETGFFPSSFQCSDHRSPGAGAASEPFWVQHRGAASACLLAWGHRTALVPLLCGGSGSGMEAAGPRSWGRKVGGTGVWVCSDPGRTRFLYVQMHVAAESRGMAGTGGPRANTTALPCWVGSGLVH